MNRSGHLHALRKIKTLLRRVLEHFHLIGKKFDGRTCGLLGHIHMMAIEDKKEGLIGSDVSPDTASEMLLSLDQSHVNEIFIFKKVRIVPCIDSLCLKFYCFQFSTI